MNCASSHVDLADSGDIPVQMPRVRSPWPKPATAEVPLLSVLTFVLWLCCAAVGTVGLTTAYARPTPPPPALAPVQAEFLNVQLTHAPLPMVAADPMPQEILALPEPSPMETISVPPPTPLMTVAAPTPAILFPLPVEGPHSVVQPEHAAHTVSTASLESQPKSPVTVITYGAGEGRQPAPTYPRQAIREGQEGIVTVRFNVGSHGRVLAAEAVASSPWPLLNEAAVRVIKERWRFHPGSNRIYEVAVRFELKR